VDDRDALAPEPVSDDGHPSEPEFRAFLAPRLWLRPYKK